MESELQALRAENQRLLQRVAELERESAFYREAFEQSPVPISVFRADGLLAAMNRVTCEILGVPSREAVVGHYNAYEDPGAVSQGYAEHYRKALDEQRGEIVIMPPTSYTSGEEGMPCRDDHTFWSQTCMRSMEVDGARYVVAVNLDITERVRAERAMEENQAFLGGIIDNAPIPIYVKDREGRYLLGNQVFDEALAAERGGGLGKTDRDLFPPEQAEVFATLDRQALLAQTPIVSENQLMLGGELHTLVTTKYPLLGADGQPHAVCSISVDVSALRAAEAEARRLQEEMFRIQEATLRALSTPLLPIAEGVVVMPLIGMLDEKRVQQAMDVLLSGIAAHHASQVILDVTGVPQVNAQVASAFVQAAQAVRLLGAQVVVTGIQPAIARTLIELGVDLGGITTRGTLQSGIAHALAARA
ncbi:PAS domain-containing protein [Chondromyces apiculatus]|uniref:RsbR, positive regulator of sigma-B n=1 Tax=Chondromyces apiculatus DSM 436 TaxID=1192034 RepID=A0A017TEW6_9BACT|nr:PAS domain-containing protein [Chondromyces apiculatus]EYF07789.1 RsbR, positive regulator of sigma-B [Chondromyces apiculatus DSM 436]